MHKFIKKIKKQAKKMKIKQSLLKKISNDRFYSKVYDKYKNYDLLVEAGFIDSKIEAKDFYNLNLLTTPVDKISSNLENTKKPVVLLSTGGFLPLHQGHFDMMELAKKELEKEGYDVVGGYFSPSHEDYVSTKPDYNSCLGKRLFQCQQAVENSSWLMIDPWESMYTQTYINFTSVIDRLEKYLQMHLKKEIKVVYVFGGDNAKFNYCFEEDGIGVCINRSANNDYFNAAKAKICNKNCIFIENDGDSAKLSSRHIRKDLNNQSSQNSLNGIFIIRDEGLLPFKNFTSVVNENKLEKARQLFLKKLIKLFEREFGKQTKVKTASMQFQLEKAYKDLKAVKTISLDGFYKGTYNLELSRLFHISSPQFHYIKMIERYNCPLLKQQIEQIPAGNYTLVDDDSVSGSTIKSIKALLPETVAISDTYLLSNILKETYFDVVDLRDFIAGAEGSGLAVLLPNNQVAKSPYMLPYVSLSTRASIKPENQYDFSVKLWKLNLNFYKTLKNIKLKHVESAFKILMNYEGFDDNTNMIDICNWHLQKLKAAK